jgi:hypothetical protein
MAGALLTPTGPESLISMSGILSSKSPVEITAGQTLVI